MDPLRIGAFELYPSDRMLVAGGKPVELGARAFDLLLVLVENQGRLVTKATLLERVWPRLVVDENNLPAQVASLRRVLGPDAIRTVPGFGYRLELAVAALRTTEAAAAANGRSGADDTGAPPRAQPGGWPERRPPLLGRDEDVRRIRDALDESGLVTIVGGAGVGKTRLAQEIATHASDAQHSGVAWASLGSIDNAQHVPYAIALALGLSLPHGFDAFAALRQALQETSVLLILDGAEHLADALAGPVEALVTQTRGVRVLTTSQTPLGVAGEIVHRLAPLACPGSETSDAEAAEYSAVTLFAQRAAAADRRFELNAANTALVAAVCRRLDGNPLALELAAARVASLGLAALLYHLDDRFRLLRLIGRTHDPRHGALHAAFDWSYSLLTPAEQRVFRALGAFAGSFSLEAASRSIVDDSMDAADAIDLIGRLVDRSLVTALSVDPPRYTLLETARCYARELLASAGELEALRGRLARTMLEVLDTAYLEYWSLDEGRWMLCYGDELTNVRAAMDWAAEHDRALAVALHGAAWPLFAEADLFAEASERYEQVVRLLTDTLPRARLGRFWEAVATYESVRRCDRARYAAELAASMYADTGDARARYYALMQLALNWRADNTAAREAFATAKKLENAAWPARLLTHGALTEGALLMSAGQFTDAREAYRRAVRLAMTVSERQALAAAVRIVELDVACDDGAAALQLGRPLSVSMRCAGRRAARIDLLAVLFRALLLTGATAEARATGAELLELAVRLDPARLYSVLDAMAYLACSELRYEAAARIACCAEVATRAHGQEHRGPTDERMRGVVERALDEALGSHWRASRAGRLTDEAAACSLALGLDA